MRTPTTFSMTADDLKKIEAMASNRKIKRSALVREWVAREWQKFVKSSEVKQV